MKNQKNIIFTVLFLAYCFVVLLNLFQGIFTYDHIVYANLGSLLLQGKHYGIDMIDTKPSSFLWVYAFLMKVFTGGKALRIIQFIFGFITLSISIPLLIAVCYRLFRNYLQSLLAAFIYVIYVQELSTFYLFDINSEAFTNIFILLALFLFVSKQKEYGKNWFWVGLCIGVAAFLRLPNAVNVLTFPLTFFIIYYNNNFSFFRNFKENLLKNYKQYLLFALGALLPWLLYFTNLTLTHSWQGFINYLHYLNLYSHNDAKSRVYLLFRPKFISIHLLFIFCFVLLYKKKGESRLFIFSLIYLIINFIFSYLFLAKHYVHYFQQTFLIYPFVISCILYPLFKKTNKNIVEKLIILFYLVSVVWVGFIFKVRTYINNKATYYQVSDVLKEVPLSDYFKSVMQEGLKEIKKK